MVIWITGLSGAGKTTLCQALQSKLRPVLPELALIDGDIIRDLFGKSLSFREEDRKIQIGRIQALAKMLSDQGLVVVVGALYAHPELLAWNRENLAGYFEIYLDAPLALVQARDSKGLYAGAADGVIPDVVGIDVPWHAPQTPDMRIDVAKGESAEHIADLVISAVPRLAATLQRADT